MQQIYPDWVKKHKSKNVEIRRLKNNFYAYKVKTIWDKKKKRPRKITESYLGKITTDGIIPAKHNREIKINHIKEYGNIKLVKLFSDKIEEILKSYFPYSYQSILVSAMIRLAYKSPLKNQYFHYCNSYLEEYYPEAVVSPNKLSELINKIGCEYGSQLGVFKDLGTGKQHFAMDMTQIFSESENIDWLEFGYNGKEEYHKQLQFLLIYSLDKAEPSFFKLLPGSIRDVSSIVNAIYESRLHNVVLVVDKGFY
jgi:transposase